MTVKKQSSRSVETLKDLGQLANYSLIDTLTCDPQSDENGNDYQPREVFSGHYVPVKPTPIQNPKYVAHSKSLFAELGFSDSLAQTEDFIKMFSGDTSSLPKEMSKVGWACGYALSIYGTEYYQQCPFQTGNGYGDGRAVSIFEGVLNGKRWEMQLKGGGRTPYCRGADGRAVLRSSVREFLAQEHMHALGIPTSRSLSLFASETQTVSRPWFSEGSYSKDPDRMIEEDVAITTRVAPSFIRVGQLELFSRRTRKNEYEKAKEELEQLVLYAIKREYGDEIDKNLPIEEQIVFFALKFRERLTSMIANWIRVGYCQGNFNSDNTAVGGFTLDYGPFGFIDMFDPEYQPWTGGGMHFSFFNQPRAAEKNFNMFCSALMPLLEAYPTALENLSGIRSGFSNVMQEKMEDMWASKLGLKKYDEALFNELISLMTETSVDYTIFFRELSSIPEDISKLEKSFYRKLENENIKTRWSNWLASWNEKLTATSKELKVINPKYTLREWFLVPAYKQANKGDYSLLLELQDIMTDPYSEQSKEIEGKFYTLKPMQFFELAGVSHVSCSS